MEKEAEYVRLMVAARRRQLALTAEGVARLETVYVNAINSIVAKVNALPDARIGLAWHQAQLQLLADIREDLDRLKRDYQGFLEVGMVQLAQAAADREAATGNLLAHPQDSRLIPTDSREFAASGGARVTVQFGRLAVDAVTRTAERYMGDGLKLSDRLYRLDAERRTAIQDTILQGLTEQTSSRDLARRLRDNLAAAGSDNPRYHASRIARTEINNAHRTAHALSVQDGAGNMKPWIQGIRWRLSSSHPESDVCDLYAVHDGDGLGPGVYKPDSLPVSHPHCLCAQLTVLKDYPHASIPGKVPDPSAVPSSMVNYYADRGDPAARAAQEAGALAGVEG